MWIFRREVLDRIQPESDGMALSQELKILAFTHPEIRCLEMPIYYGDRVGESKLNLWKDGFGNLIALGKLRFTLGRRRRARCRGSRPSCSRPRSWRCSAASPAAAPTS